MSKLEELTKGTSVRGVLPDGLVTVVSSPEAIYQSLRRRRERLEKRLREEQLLKRGADVRLDANAGLPGYVPRDVSSEKLAYDVESSIPETGRLRFIEVKGRVVGASTVTVTSGEIRTALNKPDDFILAIVQIDGDATTPRYVWQPFQREPDFGVTSVNYDLDELLERSEEPA